MAVRHSGLVKSGENSIYSSCKSGRDIAVTCEDAGTWMVEILNLEAELGNWEAMPRVRARSGGRSGGFEG